MPTWYTYASMASDVFSSTEKALPKMHSMEENLLLLCEVNLVWESSF